MLETGFWRVVSQGIGSQALAQLSSFAIQGQGQVQVGGQERSLLSEVDVISSVSGGSFTAAYYGLFGERVLGTDYEEDFLLRDVEREIELARQMVVGRARYADTARFRQLFQSRGNIDAVAVQIVAFGHHVAEVDADAKSHAAVFRHLAVARRKPLLDLDRAAHGLHRAVELRNDAVARAPEYPAMMGYNKRVNGLTEYRQRPYRGLFVFLHKTTVADHISRKNCC